jgi:MFS family permease
MAMGNTALFAAFGPAAREIGLPEYAVGAIVSAAAAMFVIGSIVWGRIADRWGRRNVAVLALSVYSVTSFGFAALLQAGLAGALASGSVFAALMAVRIVYGALGSGLQPAATGYMADISSREERPAAVAEIGAAFGLGTILGPALAASLAGFGVAVPLYAIAGLGLAAALACFLLLPEPRLPAPDTAQSGAPFALGAIARYLIIGFFTFLAVASMQQSTAFFVQDILEADAEAAARASGLCFAALAVAMVAMQAAVIPALKPVPRTLLLAGFPAGLAGLAIFAFGGGYGALVLGCAAMGAGFGLAISGVNAAISLTTGAAAQGQAAGLSQAAASAGFIVGPITATWLYAQEPKLTIALTASAMLLALLVAWTGRARTIAVSGNSTSCRCP